MTSLIQKLRDAAIGSRELDAEVAKATGIIVSTSVTPIHDYSVPEACSWSNGSRWRQLPKITTSLDAIIGLIEEKLPGQWRRSTYDPGQVKPYFGKISVSKPYGCYENYHGNHKSSEAIALCLALLSALEGEG